MDKTYATHESRIHHPKYHETVGRDFVAYGSGSCKHGDHGLTAVHLKEDKLVSVGVTSNEPPHWIVLFENVAEGEEYTLRVTFPNGDVLSRSPIAVSAKKPEARRKDEI